MTGPLAVRPARVSGVPAEAGLAHRPADRNGGIS